MDYLGRTYHDTRNCASKSPRLPLIFVTIGSADLESHVVKNTADVVTAIQCHHYMQRPERMQALRACREVLKPGGLFVTFENIAPRTAAGARFGLDAWKQFLMDNGRTELEAELQIPRYGKELLPITAEEHRDALAQAGFGVVEIFWYAQMQAGFYAIKSHNLPSIYPDI